MLTTHSSLTRFVLLFSLLVGPLTAAGVIQPHASSRDNINSWSCCPVSTKWIDIPQGHTARFELKNIAAEPVAVQLQFVNAEGEVLRQRDATIKTGNTEELVYVPNFQPVLLRAQFGTKDRRSIGLLQPALRIVESGSEKTVRLIGPEWFREIPKGAPLTRDRQPVVIPNCFTTTAFTFNPKLQVARLSVQNNGAEPTVVRLQFVDKQSSVLTQWDATIKPGGHETLDLPAFWGVDGRTGNLRAQFGTEQVGSIGLLRPELSIIANESGQALQIIGAVGFKKCQPAELRPGNDPD